MLRDKVEKHKKAAERTLTEGHGDTALGSALSPFQTRAHERKF